MKPTREELERLISWYGEGAAARLALDLMDEVERLKQGKSAPSCRAIHPDDWICTLDRGHAGKHVAGGSFPLMTWCDAQPAPSPLLDALLRALLDDRVWRRVFAAAFVVGQLPATENSTEVASEAVFEADALLSELRKREGGE